MGKGTSERAIVLLVAAVQFINILDFVMVMPLGPDYAAGLGIPMSMIGLIGGSYTAAAAVSGIAGSFFLDRFDRRKALTVAMLGLVTGTALGGLAQGLGSLVAARVVAGLFGGPATSLSISIVADVVPVERRGRAMGTVMAGFSIAQIAGVPAGLVLSGIGGWRTPFFAVAGLGLLVAMAALAVMPPMTRHLAAGKRAAGAGLSALLKNPLTPVTLAMAGALMMSAFVIIPNISGYVQFNLGYPRAGLPLLYSGGGVVSFLAMLVVGRLVDRFGSFPVGMIGTVLFVTVVVLGFSGGTVPVPVLALFIGFMLSMSFRNLSFGTLTSRVPAPPERARFSSMQSAVQHLSSAAAAVISSALLTERADHSLVGIEKLTILSVCLSLALPPAWFFLDRAVRRREAARSAAAPHPAAAALGEVFE
jgi:predicted MFS family arabinose efflux permease